MEVETLGVSAKPWLEGAYALRRMGRGTVRPNSAQKERPPEGGPTFRGDLLQTS
jgi:hypothetical protein